jgi:hypothetical protein
MSCVAVLATTAPGALAAPSNDFFQDRASLGFGMPVVLSNAGATEQSGESMTQFGDAGLDRCYQTVAGVAAGTQVEKTMWWEIVGTGRRITVSTQGSDYDTTLGLFYSEPTESTYFCNDESPNETLPFDSEAGRRYFIQVGSCRISDLTCGSGDGTLRLVATSPAAGNDNRGAAALLGTGTQATGDNFAATEEPGEALTCASERGSSPYGRTVWYRWTAPSKGTAVFTAAGFDTVLAVYAGGSAAPLRCDDDPNVAGPSRIDLEVRAGEYFIQVAGYGTHSPAAGADSRQGGFTVANSFTEDTDFDDDGDLNASDCRPWDPAIGHPTATHPHKDLPHDKIDQDCRGGDAKWPRLRADPRAGWTPVDFRHQRLTSLVVRNVRAGSRIRVRCLGRACPRRELRTVRVRRTRARTSILDRRLRRVRFRLGTTLEVRVTAPRYVGRVTRWRFRTLSSTPRADRCVNPGRTKVIRCGRAG